MAVDPILPAGFPKIARVEDVLAPNKVNVSKATGTYCIQTVLDFITQERESHAMLVIVGGTLKTTRARLQPNIARPTGAEEASENNGTHDSRILLPIDLAFLSHDRTAFPKQTAF